MSHPVSLRTRAGRFLGRLLGTGVAVWTLGVMSAPAWAVTVDQQPLIIQKSLPPNIVLMLDDSGSMAWDVMPDWNYLAGRTANELTSADVNGVYYNPAVTYRPPIKADGTRYPDAKFEAAWVDGFGTTTNTVDLSSYDGSKDVSRNGYSSSSIGYTETFTKTTTNTYTPTYVCEKGDTLVTSGSNSGKCAKVSGRNTTYYAPNTPTCNGSDTYSSSTKLCTSTVVTTLASLFKYTLRNTDGTYTRYYVGKDGACAAASLGASICTNTATARQNVANWYAYYHTRLLMAKSGLMESFSGLDPTFRVGFGSIDGNNNSGLPTAQTTKNGFKIANVRPFSEQKTAFWNWLAGGKANNGTPLRSALDAVGQYYKTSQPWEGMPSDPDYTTAAGSGELACRQSYTILTTDGFWNGDGASSSIGDADSTAKTVKGTGGRTYEFTAKAPYRDGRSDTLADVAMYYWINDLRSTADEVPISDGDPAFWQHMTTFTLGLGFTPTGITPAGTTIDQIFTWARSSNGKPIDNFSWPQPSADNINNIADLAHAAVNGHGGFYSATSPEAFAAALKDALKRATERVGTGAALAANSTELTTGTVTYQANYFTAKWKGDLKALPVKDGKVAQDAMWNAAAVLPAFAARKIVTTNGKDFFDFTRANLNQLTTVQQNALKSSDADNGVIIDYLRGDASAEQRNTGKLRSREAVLGDIVNSEPVFVGAPDPNQFIGQTFAGSGSYVEFANGKKTRAQRVLVAANDGMLHSFRADDGVEAFAYLPGAVITSDIKRLADPRYGGDDLPHQFFNDGELTVADVYDTTLKAWRTIAVGTTGRGPARSVYALDVTNPAAYAVLWERSASDGLSNSGYIGQMTGKPVIAQTANGVWSVLIGNGYNSALDAAALLQFAVADGTLTVHTTDTLTGNGLAAPAVWIGDNSNGVSTVAYAGDLLGRVWKFVLNDGTSRPDSAGSRVFTATNAATTALPITAGMLMGRDPGTGNLWLFFGTGRYLSSADLQSKATQSWFGVIVGSTNATLTDNLASKGRTALVTRTIVAETSTARASTQAVAGDMDGKSGWFMDMVSPANGAEGERMVSANLFNRRSLIGTTRIPVATDVCNPSGSGWSMSVDPFSGSAPKNSVFDTSGDGAVDGKDALSVGGKDYANNGIRHDSLPNSPRIIGDVMYVTKDNGSLSSTPMSGGDSDRQRVSWRELVNP